MNLQDALHEACNAIAIKPPSRTIPGKWVRTDTYERNGKKDGSVLIFDDEQGGIAYNWQTQMSQPFSIREQNGQPNQSTRPKPDPAKQRAREEERRRVLKACADVCAAAKAGQHPYLASKGFPQEKGLVLDDPRPLLPTSAMRNAVPEGDGPYLLVPGRIGKTITTVQFITVDGDKKNILGGQMGGAYHRVATGAETWVCEGIATALSVRNALRLLGRSATVLSAFSASNVAKVASGLTGSVIASDHDKPVEAFGGMGTGEYYAVKSGKTWIMPPDRGDFNDMHQANGINAVALYLREVVPP